MSDITEKRRINLTTKEVEALLKPFSSSESESPDKNETVQIKSSDVPDITMQLDDTELMTDDPHGLRGHDYEMMMENNYPRLPPFHNYETPHKPLIRQGVSQISMPTPNAQWGGFGRKPIPNYHRSDYGGNNWTNRESTRLYNQNSSILPTPLIPIYQTEEDMGIRIKTSQTNSDNNTEDIKVLYAKLNKLEENNKYEKREEYQKNNQDIQGRQLEEHRKEWDRYARDLNEIGQEFEKLSLQNKESNDEDNHTEEGRGDQSTSWEQWENYALDLERLKREFEEIKNNNPIKKRRKRKDTEEENKDREEYQRINKGIKEQNRKCPELNEKETQVHEYNREEMVKENRTKVQDKDKEVEYWKPHKGEDRREEVEQTYETFADRREDKVERKNKGNTHHDIEEESKTELDKNYRRERQNGEIIRKNGKNYTDNREEQASNRKETETQGKRQGKKYQNKVIKYSDQEQDNSEYESDWSDKVNHDFDSSYQRQVDTPKKGRTNRYDRDSDSGNDPTDSERNQYSNDRTPGKRKQGNSEKNRRDTQEKSNKSLRQRKKRKDSTDEDPSSSDPNSDKPGNRGNKKRRRQKNEKGQMPEADHQNLNLMAVTLLGPLEAYDGSPGRSFTEFKREFRALAKVMVPHINNQPANRQAEIMLCQLLKIKLKSKALEFLETVHGEEAMNYRTLWRKLSDRFVQRKNREYYSQQIKNLSQGNRSVAEFAEVVKHLATGLVDYSFKLRGIDRRERIDSIAEQALFEGFNTTIYEKLLEEGITENFDLMLTAAKRVEDIESLKSTRNDRGRTTRNTRIMALSEQPFSKVEIQSSKTESNNSNVINNNKNKEPQGRDMNNIKGNDRGIWVKPNFTNRGGQTAYNAPNPQNRNNFPNNNYRGNFGGRGRGQNNMRLNVRTPYQGNGNIIRPQQNNRNLNMYQSEPFTEWENQRQMGPDRSNGRWQTQWHSDYDQPVNYTNNNINTNLRNRWENTIPMNQRQTNTNYIPHWQNPFPDNRITNNQRGRGQFGPYQGERGMRGNVTQLRDTNQYNNQNNIRKNINQEPAQIEQTTQQRNETNGQENS